MAFVAAWISGVASTIAHATDWQDVQALKQTVTEADRRGDFQSATVAAEKCLSITSSGSGISPAGYSCAYYLSLALKTGKGISRDEKRRFYLLTALTALNPDDDAALALAESYLDGAGTSRDPVEAGVLFWRVEHGAWSIYSNYWGRCDECEGFRKYEKVVAKRIEQELSTDEKRRADNLSTVRFPEIAKRVAQRDAQINGIHLILSAALGGLVWWRWRSHKRSRRMIAKPANRT